MYENFTANLLCDEELVTCCDQNERNYAWCMVKTKYIKWLMTVQNSVILPY
jgi:hypothetical protein